ncbi:MAG: SDR family oxidoreductase [Planctomycetes bacterium]|nr:SDR family oxidoreductase [Planctomycetota bacterium]MCB9891144.1 SDR family oxidoreductase [Planctomycetota bacterium]MCB9918911.1 SDR family oxidoreductase [Planctomycetota bacterium]
MARVCVTGSNRGIGLALCEFYAQRGDTVHAVCRSTSPRLDALANEANVEVHAGVDVRDTSSMLRLADGLEEPIDLLICNAGISERDSLEGLLEAPGDDAILRQFEINALGALHTVFALLRRMGPGGKIGLVSSLMGSMADNTSGGYYGYRMSKAALNAAGVSLANDLRRAGIAVAILHPGYVATDMTQGRGTMSPEEAANGIARRLTQLGVEDTGTFWHASGKALPW